MLNFCRSLFSRTLKRFVSDEQGTTAIEYAMIASLVSVAILTALYALSDGTTNMFTYIADNVLPALKGERS